MFFVSSFDLTLFDRAIHHFLLTGEQGIGTSAASEGRPGSPFGGPGGFGQEVDLGDAGVHVGSSYRHVCPKETMGLPQGAVILNL